MRKRQMNEYAKKSMNNYVLEVKLVSLVRSNLKKLFLVFVVLAQK